MFFLARGEPGEKAGAYNKIKTNETYIDSKLMCVRLERLEGGPAPLFG